MARLSTDASANDSLEIHDVDSETFKKIAKLFKTRIHHLESDTSKRPFSYMEFNIGKVEISLYVKGHVSP